MASRAGNSGEQRYTVAERAHAELVGAVLGPSIAGLARALGPRTEVVLHDLTKMPNSIAAIGGPITGRAVGGPSTDLGLRVFNSGWDEDLIGYRTETEDGLVMRSSSVFFRAPSGKPVACLCINTDINALLSAQEVLSSLTATASIDPAVEVTSVRNETFALSIDALAEGILRETISAVGVPIHLMKKSHKVDVVRELDSRGFFTIREAVDLLAERLKVSRYTIYNYLNELQPEQ